MALGMCSFKNGIAEERQELLGESLSKGKFQTAPRLASSCSINRVYLHIYTVDLLETSEPLNHQALVLSISCLGLQEPRAEPSHLQAAFTGKSSHTHTNGQFRVTNQPNEQFFELQEARIPAKMLTPHRKAPSDTRLPIRGVKGKSFLWSSQIGDPQR